MPSRSFARRFAVLLPLVFLVVPAVPTIASKSPPEQAVSASPSPNLRIVGPAGEDPPVVNERKKLKLRVVDLSGSTVRAVEWRTVDAAVGRVSKRGALKGVKFGVVTIRATTESGDVAETTAVVARVRQPGSTAAQGDSKPDTGGNIYLTDPDRQVIYKSTGVVDSVFAGSRGEAGFRDGFGTNARFNLPSGLGIDVRAEGALFVADTGNNVVRAVGFNGRVRMAAGNVAGLPGTMTTDTTPLDAAAFRSPSGVASLGSNIFVADTGSHAIYFVDFAAGLVHLVAGSPGEAGYAEGAGRAARFDTPAAMAINSAGNLLAVADVANDRVRLVRLVPKPGGGFSGIVSTVGVASTSAPRAPGGGFAFDAPSAVGFDVADNLYVTSAGQAEVVTRTLAGVETRVLLAQTGSQADPKNLSVRGTEVFVLDRRSEGGSRINIVDVGPPEIASASPNVIRLAGGEEIVVRGRNFPPETRVALGDAAVASVQVVSSTEIRIVAPPQISAGARSLTILTRGGVAQSVVQVKPLGLADVDPGDIVTVAGGAIPYVGDGGVVSDPNAVIDPRDLKMDAAGNMYFADAAAHRIRRIDRFTKVLSTIAGTGRQGYSGDGGLAVTADLSGPTGVAVDPAGNVYISDSDNNRVRRVNAATGVITTVIGTGGNGELDEPGPGTERSIARPAAMVIAPNGALYVSQNGFSFQAIVRYTAANGFAEPIAVVPIIGAESVGREFPLGGSSLAIGPEGELYVASYGGRFIVRVDSGSGELTNVAGNGASVFDGDGRTALDTAFLPQGIAFDSNGNLLVSSHDRVRRIDAVSEVVTTVAGNGDPGLPESGELAVNTAFGGPDDLVVDGSGDIVVALGRDELGKSVLWRVKATSGIVVEEGAGLASQPIEFQATSVKFGYGASVGVTSTTLLIAVEEERRVFGVDLTSGALSSIAGGGSQTGDDIPADSAFLVPTDVLALETGIVISVESLGRVFLLHPETRVLHVIAGTGGPGPSGDGGPATEAVLGPYRIAADSAGNLFVVDRFGYTVRRIDVETGIISTVAGNGSPSSSGDGGPATQAGMFPVSGAVAPDGTLYVVDQVKRSIRRVDPVTGIISTVASLTAEVVAVDASGHLFAGTYGRIVQIDVETGTVTNVAGTGEAGASGDGGPALEARIGVVTGLAIGADGTIYFSDSMSGAVRAIKASAAAK